jgi:hypothetical protein
MPRQLRQIQEFFVKQNNHQRYHEVLGDVTHADVYKDDMLTKRKEECYGGRTFSHPSER